MGVSECPSSSRDLRMAATRPSIMSLGATTSAPALARLTAVRASWRSVESLSTAQPSRVSMTTPQWPWLVYSHRQTSAISTSFLAASVFFSARSPCCTMPNSSHAPEPCTSLVSGSPKSSSPPSPSCAASSASRTASSMERLKTPGMELTSRRTPSPGQMNKG